MTLEYGDGGSCDLVTLGETMALFMGPPASPLRPGSGVLFSFAGAESNVAIGVRRLGHRVAFISRVGDDDMGRAIVRGLLGEGVDVSGVRYDDSAPTSLMVRQHRTSDIVSVAYYRREGAGAKLSPHDVDAEVIRRARLLHVTGITPSLSATARDALTGAVCVASSAGVTVSLDVNHRELLWTRSAARDMLRPLLPSVDILFGGADELLLLEPSASSAEEAAGLLHTHGVGDVVLKRGPRGASAWHDGERSDQPAVEVTAVDPVGAGDAFVAGYLSAHLDGEGVVERLRRGSLCGAFAVSVHGDWEGAPRRGELETVGARGHVER